MISGAAHRNIIFGVFQENNTNIEYFGALHL